MNYFSPSNCDTRYFVIADRQDLLATINAVCAEGRWMSTTRFEPTPAWAHALTEAHCPSHLLLVATGKGQVVGWCRAFPYDGAGGAEIGIGLRKEYRNRGLGTAMLQKAVRWAHQIGFTYLRLTSRPDNARATYVFKKVGFIPTGRVERGLMEMKLDFVPLVIPRRLYLESDKSTLYSLVSSY